MKELFYNILARAAEALNARLPDGWSASVSRFPGNIRGPIADADQVVGALHVQKEGATLVAALQARLALGGDGLARLHLKWLGPEPMRTLEGRSVSVEEMARRHGLSPQEVHAVQRVARVMLQSLDPMRLFVEVQPAEAFAASPYAALLRTPADREATAQALQGALQEHPWLVLGAWRAVLFEALHRRGWEGDPPRKGETAIRKVTPAGEGIEVDVLLPGGEVRTVAAAWADVAAAVEALEQITITKGG